MLGPDASGCDGSMALPDNQQAGSILGLHTLPGAGSFAETLHQFPVPLPSLSAGGYHALTAEHATLTPLLHNSLN